MGQVIELDWVGSYISKTHAADELCREKSMLKKENES